MDLRCWMFGHKLTGQIVEGSCFLTSSGKFVDGWQYSCICCLTTDEFPDTRNVFQRSYILLLFRRLRNKWYFYRHFRLKRSRIVTFLNYVHIG